MICKIHFTYKNCVRKKELMVIVFLSLINLSRSFVEVKTPNDYLRVPEKSNTTLTCLFTDNQGAGIDEVIAKWKHDNQEIKEEIETTWDMISQIGQTRLHIPIVSKQQEGKYTCTVLIRGSFDYKNIQVQSVNMTQKNTIENKAETIFYTSMCNVLLFVIISRYIHS